MKNREWMIKDGGWQASRLPRERLSASHLPPQQVVVDDRAIGRPGGTPALLSCVCDALKHDRKRSSTPLSSAARTGSIAPFAPVLAFCLFVMLGCFPNLGQAATRASTNYSISAETQDGGGQAASSTNYSLRGSAETAAISTSASPNYQIQHGYFTAKIVAVGVLVEGRWVFYNHSAWDNTNAAANAYDDSAIATDKSALLPGGTATFVNYTSYSKGINGIMVDIANLPGTPTVADFAFKSGNADDVSTWTTAPAPASITVRRGAGVGGSDRVTLVWNDNNLDGVVDANEAVAGQWLQVTVKATANTGLAANDVFYFGNAPAESGNSTANAQVDLLDEIGARNNPRTFLNPAPIDDVFDYNRDQRVDLLDEILARNNGTTFLDALQLITPTGVSSSIVKAAAVRPLGVTVQPADAAHTNLVVALPNLNLAYNQAGQSFVIPVANSGSAMALNGVQLELITGNGDVSVGGSGGAPAITSVSLLDSGLLFATNNTGDRGAGDFSGLSQVFERLTSTTSGTVQVPNGTTPLAVVTFDTTGIAPGVYSWSAATSPNGPSFFTDTNASPLVTPTLVDGTLTIGTPLSVVQVGNEVQITWHGTATDQPQVQATSNLANGPWLSLTNTPVYNTNTGTWSCPIQIQPGQSQQFFRLVPQSQP